MKPRLIASAVALATSLGLLSAPALGAKIDAQSRRRAHSKDSTCRTRREVVGGHDGSRHRAPPDGAVETGASSTMTRPTITWWPMPQNSLHMMRKSPEAFGVTLKP